MPKIKITTDRRPWVDGKPQANGATLDVDDATAAHHPQPRRSANLRRQPACADWRIEPAL